MDKFGIFKLLNSFFNFYEQNKDSFNANSSTNKTTEQNPLNSILSAISNKNTQTQASATPQNNKATHSNAPLQNSMLSTMNSHEQFIKRVKEKHGTH